jgi:2'-5' RNA ligase
MSTEDKRLFFGLEAIAPWPHELPSGRLLKENQRHLTLAFLGKTHFPSLSTLLPSFPTPSFKVGLVGQFDKCLLLPKKHLHVVAWHVDWLENDHNVRHFQKTLVNWLLENGFVPANHERDFLPHVTLSRKPFVSKEWTESFTKLPVIVKDIHLYESLGHSNYESRWHYPIKAPFEEIEHTADIAFRIRGENFTQLHQHALVALAFKYPPLLSYFSKIQENKEMNLEDIIIKLNTIIGRADSEIGCPFKAVSFHDKLIKEENLLIWEMIVDV